MWSKEERERRNRLFVIKYCFTKLIYILDYILSATNVDVANCGTKQVHIHTIFWLASDFCSPGSPSTGFRSIGFCSTVFRSTGFRSTGVCSTGFRSTGFRSTGFCCTGFRSTGFRSTGFCCIGSRSTGFRSIGFRSIGFRSTGFVLQGSVL